MDTSSVETAKPKRLAEFDLAKALAIIFMVFVHVFEVSQESGALILATKTDRFFRNVIEYCGGVISAGVFVFVMGFMVGNSKTKTKEKLLKEAGHLFLLALLVNLFQQWVPVLFMGNIAEDFIEKAPAILATDIYTFDSLCMLCLAGIFCFDENKRMPAACLLVAVCILLNIVFTQEASSTGNVWLDTLLGLFVRINEWSYFPLVNWLPFPLVGFIFGYMYRTSKLYKKIAIGAWTLGVLGISIGTFLMKKYGLRNSVEFGSEYTQGDYYGMRIYNVIVAFGIIATCIALYYWIAARRNNEIPAILTFMSANVSDIYVIQWMLIGLLTYPLRKITSIYVNMLSSVLILAAAVGLTWLKGTIKQRKNAARTT